MRSSDGTLVEADVVVNGKPLDLAQSMTLRVAVSSFLMSCRDCPDLGSIGKLYADRCLEILTAIHGDIERQR